MRWLILFVPLLLLGWSTIPDGTLTTTDDSFFPQGRKVVLYYDFTSATDSGYVGVGLCSSISWYFDPDEDGTSTGSTVLIRESSEIQTTCAAAAPATILTCDQNGDGLINASDENAWTGATGLRGCRNVKPGAPYVCVDVTASTADDARVVIICNP